MQKRGVFEISFGMIFSIIIIIAIISVAFYVLTKFMGVSKCTQVGLFYDDLKTYTEKAWQAQIHKDTFTGSLPSGIELVCFGNFTQSPQAKYVSVFNDLQERQGRDKNVFLYPIQQECDLPLSAFKLLHVKTSNFFCVPVKNNKMQIKSEKSEFDSLVTLLP